MMLSRRGATWSCGLEQRAPVDDLAQPLRQLFVHALRDDAENSTPHGLGALRHALKTLDGHTSWVGSVVVTPDNKHAITAGGDNVIRVWDLKASREVKALEGHKVAIRGLALTADGSAYVGGDRLSEPALAERVRSVLSTRNDKTLYVKADARVPYARLVAVIDAVWTSGIENVTLLTDALPGASAPGGKPIAPKGLEMRVVKK